MESEEATTEEYEPERKGSRFHVPSAGEMFEAVKTAGSSPTAQGISLLLCLGLLGIAVWTTSLCVNEMRKTFPLRNGMQEMTRLTGYKGKSAEERFIEADTLLQELDKITKLNEELLSEILFITKKLRQGWKQKFTFLFYFSFHFETWENCLQLCKNMSTSMITIQSHEMERFLVEELKYRHQNYWIALRRENSIWTFVDGTKVAIGYWKKDADSRPGYDCAALELPCGHHVNCWTASPCDSLYRCICKESAKKRWLK